MTGTTVPLGDTFMGKGFTVARESDREFGTDFATRRRKLVVQVTVLRIVARLGRINIAKIHRATRKHALPIAEAIADLCEMGLLTLRRYPESTCPHLPLLDLVDDVEALNKMRAMVAQVTRPSDRQADLVFNAAIQARIDRLETLGHGEGATD